MGNPGAAESIAVHRLLFADAVRRGDAQTAASVYAADAHLLPPSAAPMVGREEIRAYWQAGIDSGVAEVSLTAKGAQQNDGLAYETGEYVIRVEPADGTRRVVERGRYITVHRLIDGRWLRAVEMFTSDHTTTTSHLTKPGGSRS